MAVVDFNDLEFQEQVINSSIPVLVEFWAPWCGPCRLMAPIVESIAEIYISSLIVGKVEIDINPNSRDLYGIKGVPTFILFDGGKEMARHEGAISKVQLSEFIKDTLKINQP
uniref:Thioredoxin n=1 Tax=Paulinella chromatophora TaxID=39717 RepID=B1X5D4_PAUCH|nr:thioredoxin [Paulinella chromatophora]ACB43153.1 thioredoxin [Paulinella chromatophora]